MIKEYIRMIICLVVAYFIIKGCLTYGQQTEIASYYNTGIITSNGDIFCPKYDFTAACWFYPIGTRLRITNPTTGRSCIVTVNDRGPRWDIVMKRNVVIDLTERASKYLNDGAASNINVTIEEE